MKKNSMGTEAPYARDSETSIEAARSLSPRTLETLRDRVLRAVARAGVRGMTSDELEVALGLSHQTCSARVHELHRLRLIGNSGARRKTRSGRNAVVYVAGGV